MAPSTKKYNIHKNCRIHHDHQIHLNYQIHKIYKKRHTLQNCQIPPKSPLSRIPRVNTIVKFTILICCTRITRFVKTILFTKIPWFTRTSDSPELNRHKDIQSHNIHQNCKIHKNKNLLE